MTVNNVRTKLTTNANFPEYLQLFQQVKGKTMHQMETENQKINALHGPICLNHIEFILPLGYSTVCNSQPFIIQKKRKQIIETNKP